MFLCAVHNALLNQGAAVHNAPLNTGAVPLYCVSQGEGDQPRPESHDAENCHHLRQGEKEWIKGVKRNLQPLSGSKVLEYVLRGIGGVRPEACVASIWWSLYAP